MNDETLTLYYYNDGLTPREREKIASSLATDQDVARRYQAICRQLDRLSSPAITAPPSDMVERWHDSLHRAARAEYSVAKKPVVHTWSFIWGAAVTAALAIGIGIGIFISGDNPSQAIMSDSMVASNPNSNAFVRGLQVHLRESEQGLSATPFSATADRTLLITDIIEQNRRYEKVAQQNDSHGLARVLRAFDLVLVQLAAEDITPEEAEALQAKLLFELNVVLTKLSRDTSDEALSI